MMQPSEACYELICSSEYTGAWPCKAYWDVDGWACGYGTHGPDIGPGTVWDEPTGYQRMKAYANECAADVQTLVHVPITQGQLDALTDWAYQFGSHRLAGTTMLKDLNAGDYAGACGQLPLWVHVRDANTGKLKVSKGLVARRQREVELFNSK